jgi:hypothetical protein
MQAATGGLKPPIVTWRAAEALGHAYFLERGARVLISPYDSACYDFVAAFGTRFVRVNVKLATFTQRTYQVCRAGHNSEDPDLILAWLPNHATFIELPGDFLKSVKTRRIPAVMVRDLPQQETVN